MATPLEEIHEYVDRNRKIEPYTENERKQLIMQLAQQQIRQRTGLVKIRKLFKNL